MGGDTFMMRAKGQTSNAAFRSAVEEARYEHGHGGYTGTIAEKHDYIMIRCPSGIEPEDYAWQLLDDCDPRVDDKWGPAGCIDLGGDEYLFFGWASS